jgi:hypothetical protein
MRRSDAFSRFLASCFTSLSVVHSIMDYFFYICKQNYSRLQVMAKGPEKNTKNKALHTKLLNRKKSKLQEEKKEKALRLKALVAKMNEKKN